MKKLSATTFTLALLICFTILNSCKKSSDNTPTPAAATPGTNEVWMQNTAFTPSTITVAVNTTITWTNKDGMNHTVTSTTAEPFDSGSLAPGGTYSHKFTTAGTFPYACQIHSGMTATVKVQ